MYQLLLLAHAITTTNYNTRIYGSLYNEYSLRYVLKAATSQAQATLAAANNAYRWYLCSYRSHVTNKMLFWKDYYLLLEGTIPIS